MTRVRGYVKPERSFRTIGEWEELCYYLLDLQGRGFDTRGGELGCKVAPCDIQDAENFLGLIAEYFDYQLNDEVDRWDLLTKKNVLDFIEDFVNHRVWAMNREYGQYFPDFSKLRFAFFYSRGDMEPYVLLDPAYTEMMHGRTDAVKLLKHYTTDEGVYNLKNAIESGEGFDISSFTVANRTFFRKESNRVILFEGLVKAAFRSDVKSFAVDNGLRAANLFRFEYPGDDQDNICYDLDAGCDAEVRTSLWNEIIARPLKIIKIV